MVEDKKIMAGRVFSFSQACFAAAFLLGILFLSLGMMRVHVSALEKRLACVERSIVDMQDYHAEILNALALATRPEVVICKSEETQDMLFSLKRMALLHVPLSAQHFGSSPQGLFAKNEEMPAPSVFHIAGEAVLDFLFPLASAHDETF